MTASDNLPVVRSGYANVTLTLLVSLKRPMLNVQTQTNVIDAIGGQINLDQTIGFTSLGQFISTVFTFAVFGAAIAAFAFITLGAFKYITAGSSTENTQGARRTIVNAVVGLVLMGLVIVFYQLLIQVIPGLDQFFTINSLPQ